MTSISNRLLVKVLSVYIALTVAIFAIEVGVDYRQIRSGIVAEINLLHANFGRSVAYGLWNMDKTQLEATGAGMLNMPSVTRVIMFQTNGDIVYDASASPDKSGSFFPATTFYSRRQIDYVLSNDNRTTSVGLLEIQSNSNIIVKQMQRKVLFSLFSGMIKSLLLVFLVKYFFDRYLSRPMVEIARRAAGIDPKQRQISKLPVDDEQDNELTVISRAINGLTTEIEATVGELDQLNTDLELKVARRTEQLQTANAALDKEKKDLNTEVSLRKEREHELEKVNGELAQSLTELHHAQATLVESAKMAALGELVAGVAHEINTPVGLGLTGASHFQYLLQNLDQKYRAGELDEADFEKFMNDAKELARSVQISLEKAAALVRSFKLVAVDQGNDEKRQFNVAAYLNDIVLTHRPALKKRRVELRLTCDEHLMLTSYPGAWSQLISNLISNSLIHGFTSDIAEPRIEISVSDLGEGIDLIYQDNGIGMSEEVARRVFDPFFTTNREGGGSGLGMHIAYNLVVQRLMGTISVETSSGHGVRFSVHIPRTTETGDGANAS